MKCAVERERQTSLFTISLLMLLGQKGGMCTHVREGDEDMITQKYKPQNEILGLSASKRSNNILAFLSGHDSPAVLSLPGPLSRLISQSLPPLYWYSSSSIPPLLHPSPRWFAVIPPDPGNQGSDAAQPKQMQCFPSKIFFFIKRQSCATLSTFPKAVFLKRKKKALDIIHRLFITRLLSLSISLPFFQTCEAVLCAPSPSTLLALI